MESKREWNGIELSGIKLLFHCLDVFRMEQKRGHVLCFVSLEDKKKRSTGKDSTRFHSIQSHFK